MFRERFELEVEYFWQRLRRLGERFPSLAPLYSRNADPRITRLVQSAAFAFASVHARIHDDGQTLVRPLVSLAMPECLRPRPASTILQLTRSHFGTEEFFGEADRTRIRFKSYWPVEVAPISLSGTHLERVHATLQVLHFQLVTDARVPLVNVLPKRLRIFVRVEPVAAAIDLIHALRGASSPVRLRGFDPHGVPCFHSELAPDSVQWPRVDSEEPGMGIAPTDRFHASTLLRELYAFPESFCFFEIVLPALEDSNVATLELSLALARVVDGLPHLRNDHLLLACAPATNEYEVAIEPLREAAGQDTWPVSIPGRPKAEVIHILGLEHSSGTKGAERRPILSWEAPLAPHRYRASDAYFVAELTPSIDGERTEMQVSFATMAGFHRPLPGAVVEGNVLASDGTLAEKLGLGDVGGPQGAANVCRIAPSRRAPLGKNHAWRVNAYARMPPFRLATPMHLREFFALHDASGARDEANRINVPVFARARHARGHRLVDGMLEWGDLFTVDLDPKNTRVGEAWLLCELLSRTLAERSERLRFSQLTVTRDGQPFASFSPRQGARLPFPLG